MNLRDLFSKLKKPVDLSEGPEFQGLESEQQEMIRGVVELSDTTVKEVMVPRIDTVFLPRGWGAGGIAPAYFGQRSFAISRF